MKGFITPSVPFAERRIIEMTKIVDGQEGSVLIQLPVIFHFLCTLESLRIIAEWKCGLTEFSASGINSSHIMYFTAYIAS